MSYGNYAPFYRTGYFNPMQTQQMPTMADGQNQYAQPYQPPMQTQQMPMQTQQQPLQPTQMPAANDMIWVLNETEATSYPVAPGNSVTLWDKNTDTVYIKSVNAQGMPSMRILDYTERMPDNAPKKPDKHICECGKEFVKIKDFEALEGKFEDLSARVDTLTAPTKTKAKAKEDVDNG